MSQSEERLLQYKAKIRLVCRIYKKLAQTNKKNKQHNKYIKSFLCTNILSNPGNSN